MNPADRPVKTESCNKDETSTFSANFFYEKFADMTVRLKDGKVIKFNKAALIINAKSKVLYETLDENLQDPHVIDIPDIEYDSFKIFLDCLMEFELYSFDNALKIFPLAWKYQIAKSIDKCMKCLQFTEMTPKICEILNMAAQNKFSKLLNQTYDFIRSSGSMYKILENEEYCHLLEPEALSTLLPRICIDSYILKKVMEWGEEYMKKKRLGKFSRNIFTKWGLSRFFKLDYFETTGAIAEFCLSKIGKGYFTHNEVLTRLRNSENLISGKSEWLKIQKNDTIVEKLFIPKLLNTFSSKTVYISAHVKVKRNKATFYDKFEKDKKIISCNLVLIIQNPSGGKLVEIQKEFLLSQENINSLAYSYETLINGFSVDAKNARVACIFKITWTFLYDCRVLLMNRPGDILNHGSNKMFYIRNASCNFQT